MFSYTRDIIYNQTDQQKTGLFTVTHQYRYDTNIKFDIETFTKAKVKQALVFQLEALLFDDRSKVITTAITKTSEYHNITQENIISITGEMLVLLFNFADAEMFEYVIDSGLIITTKLTQLELIFKQERRVFEYCYLYCGEKKIKVWRRIV